MSSSDWSLFKKQGDKEEFLEPLKFSNGKTQEDVVNEVFNLIKSGQKIIFIKGVCGTGKSAIALNIARKLGKASIVVPVKNLQKQYEQDYTNEKYVLKPNNEKLIISVISGRKNHKCPFIKENPEQVENVIEKNATLDIFDDNNILEKKYQETTCDNPYLPCKIEIKSKNMGKIKEYLKQNERIKSSFLEINNVRRMSIAPVCPYWSPIVPETIDLGVLNDAKKLKYEGLEGIKYNIYQRKKGCAYYEQFNSYIHSDVLIFNSHKYKLETVMNRKPATEVEIIDECDEFLDSFSNTKNININRLSMSMFSVFSDDEKTRGILDKISTLLNKILKDKKIKELVLKDEIIPINQTDIGELLKDFSDNNLVDAVEVDEISYFYHVDEVARIFRDFLDETYISYYKEGEDIVARLVTTNLEKRFKELIDKNKALVLMSGTIHSEKVLKDIFGIDNFQIVEAETKPPGKINMVMIGKELNCKYANFQTGLITRKEYLLCLDECVRKARKPCLVHVNSFADLPNEEEKREYMLKIMTSSELKEKQYNDPHGELVEDFKKAKMLVLYSTKAMRGVDFPGETCNSIIMTKYPYPAVNSIFWRVLRKTKPQYYKEFYIDKARREFLQRIYRGLRSINDKIDLLSPDCRVFENFYKM